MVLIKSVSDIYKMIDNIDWFFAIGKPIQEQNIVIIPNIEEAIHHWLDQNFEEARSIAWESFRQVVVKDSNLYSRWERDFNLCNQKLIESMRKSPTAIEIAKMAGQTIEEFSQAFPFVGAVGELITFGTNNKYTFNLKQIPYYELGHWVCGWHGKLSLNEFIYPAANFYIY